MADAFIATLAEHEVEVTAEQLRLVRGASTFTRSSPATCPEKIVFQSDLVGLPYFGPMPPASPATVDFLDKVKKLGLQVETIAGGHGRTGTLDEVSRTVATR